jgi:hypothetical protein
MYCGLTNNTVSVFDIRNTNQSLYKLDEPVLPKIFSPIHSMTTLTIDSKTLLICSNLVHSYCWIIDIQDNNLREYKLIDQSREYSYDTIDSKI